MSSRRVKGVQRQNVAFHNRNGTGSRLRNKQSKRNLKKKKNEEEKKKIELYTECENKMQNIGIDTDDDDKTEDDDNHYDNHNDDNHEYKKS